MSLPRVALILFGTWLCLAGLLGLVGGFVGLIVAAFGPLTLGSVLGGLGGSFLSYILGSVVLRFAHMR